MKVPTLSPPFLHLDVIVEKVLDQLTYETFPMYVCTCTADGNEAQLSCETLSIVCISLLWHTHSLVNIEHSRKMQRLIIKSLAKMLIVYSYVTSHESVELKEAITVTFVRISRSEHYCDQQMLP